MEMALHSAKGHAVRLAREDADAVAGDVGTREGCHGPGAGAEASSSATAVTIASAVIA